MVPTSYKGLDDDHKVKTVLEINQNNNYCYYSAITTIITTVQLVTLKMIMKPKKCFDEDAKDKVEATPKTTVNT